MTETKPAYPLGAFPRKVTLRDRTEVVLKPMVPSDSDALLRFFARVPDSFRYYLKDDVTSRQVIERWARELDYDRVLPILAWAGSEVVADGTLHRHRAGARHHIGELRIVVDPAFRQRGVGTAVTHALLSVAHGSLLERVYMEVIAEVDNAAASALQWWGFQKVAVLPRYARDRDGTPHDVIIYEMPLDEWVQRWQG